MAVHVACLLVAPQPSTPRGTHTELYWVYTITHGVEKTHAMPYGDRLLAWDVSTKQSTMLGPCGVIYRVAAAPGLLAMHL